MESEQTGRWEQTLQKQTRGEQAQPASWSNHDLDLFDLLRQQKDQADHLRDAFLLPSQTGARVARGYRQNRARAQRSIV